MINDGEDRDGPKGLEVEVFGYDLYFSLEGVTTFSVNGPMGHLRALYGQLPSPARGP